MNKNKKIVQLEKLENEIMNKTKKIQQLTK
jgi:hypothetical protein